MQRDCLKAHFNTCAYILFPLCLHLYSLKDVKTVKKLVAKAAQCSFRAASLVGLPFIHGTASCALLKILSGEIVVMVRLG